MKATDTIFALASGPGPAGVAVVRVSGPAAGRAAESLAGRALPPARRAVFRRFRRPDSAAALDEGILLWFPGPQSFTGEDVAEFHLHGGRAVIAAVLDALGAIEGCRMAEAGEFTRRAFENGRLDLTRVEGLADLVNAETEAQRRLAVRGMEGALAAVYDGWRERLVAAMAHLEASIDFAEEELPADVAERALADVDPLIGELEVHLADGRGGEILRDGLSIVILGAPNAGKSSLLNQLARREAAIVSARAGTTRDVIDVHLSLGGYPVILTDTAGLREVDGEEADEIEMEGVRRARSHAAAADLRLVVFDATLPPDAESLALVDETALVVANKADLLEDRAAVRRIHRGAIPVSAKTGAGIGDLVAALTRKAESRMAGAESAVITRARHREAIETAIGHLRRAKTSAMPELIAEDLRLAARALGRVTGRVDVEDLLDVIFQDFCIGK